MPGSQKTLKAFGILEIVSCVLLTIGTVTGSSGAWLGGIIGSSRPTK